MNRPNKIIIHHTGGTNSNPLADTSHHTFKMVDSYHKSLGWGKIGYHYFIEKNGKITQGRQDYEIGAHTIGENSSSLGVCLAGNFDRSMPTAQQENTLKDLLRRKVEEFNISTSAIVPHRTYAKKTCYGKNLSNTWAAELIDDQVLKLKLMIQLLQLRIAIARFLGLSP
jgi:N-acetylmuramoyl-L-alanine amidase